MLFHSIKFIVTHPIFKKNKWQTLSRILKWQVGIRFLPFPVIYPFVEKCELIVKKGMTGATGNVY